MQKVIIMFALVLIHQTSMAQDVELKNKTYPGMEQFQEQKFQVTLTTTQLQQFLDSGILNNSNKILPLNSTSKFFKSLNPNATATATEFDTHEIFNEEKMGNNLGGNW